MQYTKYVCLTCDSLRFPVRLPSSGYGVILGLPGAGCGLGPPRGVCLHVDEDLRARHGVHQPDKSHDVSESADAGVAGRRGLSCSAGCPSPVHLCTPVRAFPFRSRSTGNATTWDLPIWEPNQNSSILKWTCWENGFSFPRRRAAVSSAQCSGNM